MSKERFLLSLLLLITGLRPGDSRALKKLWTLWSTTHPQRPELGSPRLCRAGEAECALGVLGRALFPKEGLAEPAHLPSPSSAQDCGLGSGSCCEKMNFWCVSQPVRGTVFSLCLIACGILDPQPRTEAQSLTTVLPETSLWYSVMAAQAN